MGSISGTDMEFKTRVHSYVSAELYKVLNESRLFLRERERERERERGRERERERERERDFMLFVNEFTFCVCLVDCL
jgi:hypothetical protein